MISVACIVLSYRTASVLEWLGKIIHQNHNQRRMDGMKYFIFARQWGWLTSGIALGLTFLLAVMIIKPMGVSTQFVIFDGIVWNSVDSSLIIENTAQKSGYASDNAYLNKSGGKYAANVANPLNYSFIFVISMFFGGFLAKKLQKPTSSTDKQARIAPPVWRSRFGDSALKRYSAAFIGGVLVLFGARLAGGCTSGHMMSGMMQTSLSGYLFALSAFLIAIPTALILFKKGA
ncbi:YeeE/YedE family protein [Suttonella sp. R2A3]|uniref:YeeE/YedE thiosulfate transporter family protein n=1 Tax=Suttonella sp. R2A3 TaxID=2908648 RepID=UPI001F1ACA3E|nr:YeeE/YedE thiosulfate transporter family protein [Suttonella sp. R2A3]UJF23959.1 YeeE/YedE family protein [Suttonella sp. R2A3]